MSVLKQSTRGLIRGIGKAKRSMESRKHRASAYKRLRKEGSGAYLKKRLKSIEYL